MKATLVGEGTAEAAVARVAKALAHECRGMLRGAPRRPVIEVESHRRSTQRLSGRAQGERARSELEERTISMELDQTIAARAGRVLRGPYDTYIATADRLTWSDPTITALVRQKAARLREDLAGPPVALCAEMRSWAASGFHQLPPGSRRWEEAERARDKQTVEGNLEKLLRPYEGPAERTILQRTEALTEQRSEKERANQADTIALYHMALALGEKPTRFGEQIFGPVISRGRTQTGTRFVIRASAGKGLFSGSCKHEVQVEIRKRRNGGATDICLGEAARQSLSGSCSGPVETLQFATPPDVRRVRVRLSNGRTVTVSVVQIPAKDGGPAGIFIDTFRGYNPYPVSGQKLDSAGKIVRTVGLSGMRCTKKPGGGPEAPQSVNLATITAPYGEPLSIEGTLLHYEGHTELVLAPETGLRNSAGGDERGKPKQFKWNLSTECAPHPYSLLAGILAPPGASVLVRIPAGLAALTKIELAASMHAEGPLFYGIYTTPPTEIIVENADGTILYTENLAHKATEETEFCEGYAER